MVFVLRRLRRTLSLPFILACVLFLVLFVYLRNSEQHLPQALQDWQHHENPQAQPNAAGEPEAGKSLEGSDNDLIDWHNYTQIDEEGKRQGPGEQGTAVNLPAGQFDEKQVNEAMRANGFNAIASDQISLFRAMKDIRHEQCRQKKYHRKLPTASVVIPFHQEHWTTLLRTALSAIHRAPPSLLKEVILVDDFSTKEFLKEPLDKYVQEHYPNQIKIVRMDRREGLIRARLAGAKAATADVVIFLDSHCECNVNWLPPLLDPISENYRTVTCPFIDVIDADNFAYRPQDEGARGAFDWEFYYKRLPRLPDDAKHPVEPFDSPIMAGGLFAISRQWFWELGGYDPGLDIWGGEQYELSFKIWQCGGRMVDTPCSRIGHIYRKFAPFPNPGVGDFISKNFKRVAEVWMDEYKEYLYQRAPQRFNQTDPGDLSAQLAIRQRLNCKPFKWFMETVAFDLTKHYPPIPPEPYFKGEIRNVDRQLCLDGKFQMMHAIEVSPCVKNSSVPTNGEQVFEFNFRHEVKPDRRGVCLDYSGSDVVLLFPCHGGQGNQGWVYKVRSKHLYQPTHNLCLDVKPGRTELMMKPCDDTSQSQRWEVENLNEKLIATEFGAV